MNFAKLFGKNWSHMLHLAMLLATSVMPPPELLCPYSKLAWEFAQHILPSLAGQDVYDALQISACTNATAQTAASHLADRPHAIPHPRGTGSFRDRDALFANGAVVVDPVHGSDEDGDGDVASPFRSLRVAINAACSLQHAANGRAKRVVLQPGNYNLGHPQSPLTLGPEASGLELVAATKGAAVITGGTELIPAWKRLPPPEHGGGSSSVTYVADLKPGALKQGVKISELLAGQPNSGVSLPRRLVTAREPNADIYEYASWQGGLKASSNWGEMTWSKQAAKIISKKGAYERQLKIDQYFQGAEGGSLDAFADGRGCGWAGHAPFQRSQGLVWTCAEDQPWCSKPWSNVTEASVWCSGQWANIGYTVAAAATNASEVNLTFANGGFQMAFGSADTGVCKHFYLEGIVEALDSPGEFYHDVAGNRLYIVTNATEKPPSSVLAVTEETLLSFNGTQQAPVVGVSITGTTFRGAAS